MVNLVKIILLPVFFILNFNISFAQDKNQFYGIVALGTVDYGITTADLQSLNTSLVNLGFSSSTSSTDNTGLYWKAHGGMNINEYLAVEGGYTSLGTLVVDTTLTGPAETVKTEITATAFEISGLGKYTFNKNYGFIRLGMTSFDIDTNVTTTKGSATLPVSSGTGFTYGLGAHFAVRDKSGFRIEFQGYELDSAEVSTLHFGYTLNF